MEDLHVKTYAIVFLSLLLSLSTPIKSQEKRQTAPASDLTPGLKVALRTNPDAKYTWTLIGVNERAAAQEKNNPELNVISRIWHMPLAKGRHAFKFEFTKPYIKGSNVFHMYLKTDGDEKKGRVTEGSHKGVDYVFTLTDGNPDSGNTLLAEYTEDGKSRGGISSTVVTGSTIYLSAEMSVLQKEGSSLFEYFTSSYIKEVVNKGYKVIATSNFGYNKAVSEGEPETVNSNKSLLMNQDMLMVSGTVPGWTLYRRPGSDASFVTDGKEKDALTVEGLYHRDKLYQSLNLAPGFYVVRALVKTNTHQVHLSAINENYMIPVGVSEDYKWIELPFPVTLSDKEGEKNIDVALAYIGYPPTRHPATIHVKRMELHRMGETVLPENWVAKTPVNPIHEMKLINQYPNWDRPGKVIFRDSFIGTELWLMTQAGKVDHSYVGTPDFSHEGKYIYTGWMKTPRGLLRTDGSARYMNDRWKSIVWLFPWELKRLPKGAAPEDWICTSRSLNLVALRNVVTGETLDIKMPSRPGWKLIENPCTGSSRGPNVRAINHDTLIWHSDDSTMIGLSDMNGEKFRSFKIKSISAKVELDEVYPRGPSGQDSFPISNVWGKAWNNWRNAVDKENNRYYVFDMNRGKYFDDPDNPYQVWALSLTEGDKRGLLRVIPNPKVTITEHLATHSGGRPQPSYNWWEFAAGLPRSGDNAILLLEDGTLIHMSSMGMHSHFRNTISVNDPYTGKVTFIGNNWDLDRITWPHEFRRDKDFATVEGYAEPVSPFLMIDLENKTYWTAAFTNFFDYHIRYRTRLDKTAYHKPMFRTSSTPSPDFTKVVFFSPMLTGDHPDRLWADLYVAVVRYPQPPANVRIDKGSMVWDKPRYHREIEGFNLYRSSESGRNYERVNSSLLKGNSHALPPGSKGFYVLTSVEYSGLESRIFSNEVSAGSNQVFRIFCQAETGKLKEPMVPFFEPKGASNSYAVAVTDPEHFYSKKLKEGLTGSVKITIDTPRKGDIRIIARVRGMSDIERQSYTTGWPPAEKAASGKFTVNLKGKKAGEIPVRGIEWQWIEMDKILSKQPAGKMEIEFETGDAGIAIDNIIVTNDPGFTPVYADNTPLKGPSSPGPIRIEELVSGKSSDPLAWRGYKVRPPYLKISWGISTAPQGVRYYNIYRSDKREFEAEHSNLLGSSIENIFIDPELENGKEYHYKVVAVDSWGNVSKASNTLSITIK